MKKKHAKRIESLKKWCNIYNHCTGTFMLARDDRGNRENDILPENISGNIIRSLFKLQFLPSSTKSALNVREIFDFFLNAWHTFSLVANFIYFRTFCRSSSCSHSLYFSTFSFLLWTFSLFFTFNCQACNFWGHFCNQLIFIKIII